MIYVCMCTIVLCMAVCCCVVCRFFVCWCCYVLILLYCFFLPRCACQCVHPVRIARIRYPRFVPRVGLGFKEIHTLSALRISKGWVRKDPNLGLRTGCMCDAVWVRGGGRVLLTEIPLPRIARLASNRSTGSRLLNFDKRTSSNNSNWEIWAQWGFPTLSSPLPNVSAYERCSTTSCDATCYTVMYYDATHHNILQHTWL